MSQIVRRVRAANLSRRPRAVEVGRSLGARCPECGRAQRGVRLRDRRSLPATPRLRFFLGIFATLAVLLSAVGVYGTVRYAVARRRAEFAIQLALGAMPSRVFRDVVRGALAPVVVGATCGVGGTLLLSRALQGFLYGVAPTDAASFGVAIGALLTAAIVAALGPALGASRASPAESLRAG